MSNIPYTYLIGWSREKTYYYGVRFSKKCNPNELWKTYFTSSKCVKEFRKKYGEPDIIQVRKTFISSKLAREWEYKVIKRMKIVESDIWLNKSNRGEYFHITKHSEETKRKISKSTKGRSHGPMSEKQKQKISIAQKGEKSVHWGKRITEEHKEKIRLSSLGKTRPQFFSSANPFFNKKHSTETKEKLSRFMNSPERQIKCPHCGKIGHSNIMPRWHFDKCKFIDQISLVDSVFYTQ